MKNQLSELLILYPTQKQVYQSADGIIHLSEQGAQAQARHLVDQSIKTIQCPDSKTSSQK